MHRLSEPGRTGCAVRARSRSSPPAQGRTWTRSRGTAWPSGAPTRRRWTGSTPGSSSTGSPTSSSASGFAIAAVARWSCRTCRSRSTSTGCGRRPIQRSASACPGATCTASSTGGANGPTSWSVNREPHELRGCAVSSRGPRLTFDPVGDDYPARISDLKSRRAKNLAMGGEAKIAKQHERGKLTVRERLDLLFDKDTFVELGLLAPHQPVRGAESHPQRPPPAALLTAPLLLPSPHP